MLSGNNPADAIEYFYKFKIFSHILKFPKSCEELANEDTVNDKTLMSLRICQVLSNMTL